MQLRLNRITIVEDNDEPKRYDFLSTPAFPFGIVRTRSKTLSGCLITHARPICSCVPCILANPIQAQVSNVLIARIVRFAALINSVDCFCSLVTTATPSAKKNHENAEHEYL
jgi:hypothetical protein